MAGRNEDDGGRRLTALARELPLALTLAVVAAGLAFGALVSWRPGALLVGAALLLAAVCRLVLPARRAGLLVVRSRRMDVAVLLALGAALLVLASSVPDV